jgi:hypothetical protein
MYFKCIDSIFMVYFDVFIMYLNVFECVYSIFIMYLNVLIVYLWYVSMCFNAFESIWMYLLTLELNFSPSYSHCNVFAMRIHVHIWFLLLTMTTFLRCYTTKLFSPIPIALFQLPYNLWKNYISILTFHVYTLPHIPHSTFHIPCRHWLREA